MPGWLVCLFVCLISLPFLLFSLCAWCQAIVQCCSEQYECGVSERAYVCKYVVAENEKQTELTKTKTTT